MTIEEIRQLSPDTASLKAGEGLSKASKWVSGSLGRKDDLALWGEIAGSGAKPYQVRVDLSGPAYQCSCPSRKFPCKHSIGLMLIHAQKSDDLASGEPPEWAAEWFNKRAVKAAPKPAEPETEESAAKKKAQAEKTQAKRNKEVEAGLDEFERWMHDAMREGLAMIQSKRAQTIEERIRRLGDNKATGLRALLLRLRSVPEKEWAAKALEIFGLAQLLIEGFRHLDAQTELMQIEILNLLGATATIKAPDLFANYPAVADRWLVLGRREEEDDFLKIKKQYNWLYGENTRQYALILNFEPLQAPGMLDMAWTPGAIFEAELVYYPSIFPQRAKDKVKNRLADASINLSTDTDFNALLARMGAGLTASPWLEAMPTVLGEVTPFLREGQWLLADKNGATLPMQTTDEKGWELMAQSGGYPINLSAEWNGRTLIPFITFG